MLSMRRPYGAMQGCGCVPLRLQGDLELPYFQGIEPIPPRPLAPCCPVCYSPAAVSYSAGACSAPIRRSMAPDSRRVPPPVKPGLQRYMIM
jgi:hypothetical protein